MTRKEEFILFIQNYNESERLLVKETVTVVGSNIENIVNENDEVLTEYYGEKDKIINTISNVFDDDLTGQVDDSGTTIHIIEWYTETEENNETSVN